MVDVHTVGAGGGSIAWRDAGGALRVGPRSAGAGLDRPAMGGAAPNRRSPTRTSCSATSPPTQTSRAASPSTPMPLREHCRARREAGPGRTETAEGIVRVANQEMIRALRVVTVERGVDPRGYALLPFGGAGPMHAAALAAELEISRIVCPRASGVLSALGLIAAGHRRDTARTVLLAGDQLSAERIAGEVAALSEPLRAGMEGAEIEVVYELRYRGQAFELPVPGSPAGSRAAGRGLRGRARGSLRLPRSGGRARAGHDPGLGGRARPRAASQGGGRRQPGRGRAGRASRILGRDARASRTGGVPAEGPCVFELPEATLVLPPGWTASVDQTGTITADARAAS